MQLKEEETRDILISRILKGVAGTDEIEEFAEWIKDIENERYFEQYKEVWHSAQEIRVSEGKKEQSLQSLIHYIRYNKKRNINRRRFIFAISSAAAILLFFGLFKLYDNYSAWHSYSHVSFSELKYNTDSIKVELSDGRVINPMRKSPYYAMEKEINLNSANQREISYTDQKEGPHKKKEKLKYNSVSIPSGERFAVVLSDGTRVFLNSNSYIRYPVSFGKESREVTLEGRAYFDVQKSDVPFIVTTSDMKVEVLGTSFDVESKREATSSSVILVEGSVKVLADGQSKIISPNEMLSINRIHRNISVSNVDSKSMTLWKDGILVLKEQSIDSMLESLCSWYGVEIINNSTVSKREKFNGKFDRENIEAAMKTIALSAKVRYKIENGILIIEDMKD